ncbi:MAG: enoyl-CoA hydratase/isomerase family protein [Chloroflexi bacterium]|nr:MAG: enoyl-CoA hydratase/isomerase family protein [Chloroflexota bacterium]
MTQSYETIDLAIDGWLAHITLNRPDVENRMNVQMMDELLAAFDALRDNRDIRAVILSGAGGNFCGGGDLNDFALNGKPHADDAAILSKLEGVLRTIAGAPHVIIAKIDGVAMGGGFGLVCVCDIAIASATAQFGMSDVRIGIIPALVAPFVIERIGMMRARELMLTGRTFDGVSAHEYGILHDVCPAQVLDVSLQKVLDDLQHCNPAALIETKRMLAKLTEKGLDKTHSYRVNTLNRLLNSDDLQEGIAANRENRHPNWAQ